MLQKIIANATKNCSVHESTRKRAKQIITGEKIKCFGVFSMDFWTRINNTGLIDNNAPIGWPNTKSPLMDTKPTTKQTIQIGFCAL
jgi:hypothetical protein